ncbi:hypothetical protein Micbo1qcDRAFT_156433, partial [Microdochium bolleyi]
MRGQQAPSGHCDSQLHQLLQLQIPATVIFPSLELHSPPGHVWLPVPSHTSSLIHQILSDSQPEQ